MLPKEVTTFLDSRLSNQWIQVGSLDVYVRKSHRFNPRFPKETKALIRCFDIANVTCGHKGCGEFGNFLHALRVLSEHGFQAIYIEQVLTNRFANYFRKIGAVEVQDLTSIPSFFYILDN